MVEGTGLEIVNYLPRLVGVSVETHGSLGFPAPCTLPAFGLIRLGLDYYVTNL